MADTASTDSQVKLGDIREQLEGLEFPASKGDVVRRVRQQGGKEDVVSLLEQLPDQNFMDSLEVIQAAEVFQAYQEEEATPP